MPVPSRNDWKALKARHDIRDGAVKGVNVGQLLADLHKALDRNKRLPAAKKLEKGLADYIKKLDRNKVTDYNGFQRVFLNNYLNEARQTVVDLTRQAGGLNTLKTELTKFFAAVQKLDEDTSTGDDLRNFYGGTVRGLTAVASRVQGIDMALINAKLEQIGEMQDDLPDAPSKQQTKTYIDTVKRLAHEVADEAEELDLV